MVGLSQGWSYREIGRKLGRTHRAVRQEIRRNAPYFQEYVACRAQAKADRRASNQRRKAPLKSPAVFLYVRGKLRKGWSPEIVAGRLKLEHGLSINPETIYRYIYKRENRRYRLWEKLPLGRKKRKPKGGRKVRNGRIPGAVSIDLRPKVVERRNQPGHWESDLMEGKKSGPVVSTSVERKTRYTSLTKLENKTAQAKVGSLVQQLSWLPDPLRRTLTLDNGMENTSHIQISRNLSMDVYFCHAYHAWEKGTVGNTIKRLRRYIPKGADLTRLDPQTLALIEDHYNHTPRKCLGYFTPYEKMMEYLDSYL